MINFKEFINESTQETSILRPYMWRQGGLPFSSTTSYQARNIQEVIQHIFTLKFPKQTLQPFEHVESDSTSGEKFINGRRASFMSYYEIGFDNKPLILDTWTAEIEFLTVDIDKVPVMFYYTWDRNNSHLKYVHGSKIYAIMDVCGLSDILTLDKHYDLINSRVFSQLFANRVGPSMSYMVTFKTILSIIAEAEKLLNHNLTETDIDTIVNI